jgi:hypothetical protein
MYMRRFICHLFYGVLLISLSTQVQNLWAQGFYVDKKGIIREKKGNAEATFYGVNYTLPFAHAYRMHKALGVDPKEAIDKDVYHFARLGFNAYRVHVWDVEISDVQGNLLVNEHLDLLDYLVYKLKERNIKILLTPMAYWGNGYPERDDAELPGFSAKWNKREVTRNETAIAAQENYLNQFVSHINPYTGIAYKNDPDLAGFEVNNEPSNESEPAFTTDYVSRMVKAIRATGCKTPVFYNVSHNFQNTQAFYDAQIDGGTFQWYPTGLVAGYTRRANYLPAVDSYRIPFDSILNFNKRALIVYEFDAADVADSYLYPAIARSFRTAGFQWVTQFAYDPIEIAWANTEYQTHFLNLAYTPQKAISMKIAAEVMKQVPRKTDFGTYPLDTLFGTFRVSYNEKLSELNTATQFIHSNSTTTQPQHPQSLTEIAGYGSSPIIAYEGTGAYFLDKLSDGIWRLEVMPDAIWLEDPFGRPSLKREAAAVLWNEWDMTIRIPDLGNGFTCKSLLKEELARTSRQSTINVYPGVYLLRRNGILDETWTPDSKFGNIQIGEYVAPDSRINSFTVLHQPAKVITAGVDHTLSVQVVGPSMPDSVCLFIHNAGYGSRMITPQSMMRTSGYTYSTILPATQVRAGSINYSVIVYHKGKTITFPANTGGKPSDWDYYVTENWSVKVEPPEQFLTLLDVHTASNAVATYLLKGFSMVKTEEPGAFPSDKRIRISVKDLTPDNQIIARMEVKDRVDGRRSKLAASKLLKLNVGEVGGIDRLCIGFITTDGYTYKTEVAVMGKETLQIPLTHLTLRKTIIRPVAYPSFLPDYFTPTTKIPFNINNIESLEITAGEGQAAGNAFFEIGDIWLE